MAKVDLEDVESVLLEVAKDKSVVASVVAKLQSIIEEDKAERDGQKEDKPKYIPMLISTDPDANVETPMFLVKIREDADHNQAADLIRKAAKQLQADLPPKKARRLNIASLARAIQVLKNKDMQGKEVQFFPYREPLVITATSNFM